MRRCPDELFRAGGADAGGRAAADQAEPAARGPTRPRSGLARRARRASKCWPGSGFPTAPSRSRWPMPATSSATSCRSSAMAAPSCSARSIDGDGVRRDIQLKGSGRRPSRAAAMAAPRSGRCCANTSSARRWRRSAFRPRASLAAVMTGESVMRETPLPGAVLTRVAASHIRVGTFQYFAARGDTDRRAPARRPRHRPPLSAKPPMPSAPITRCWKRVIARAGRAGRALAAGRLHPRRHEHRQHLDLGRDHRLRPLRLHGPL